VLLNARKLLYMSSSLTAVCRWPLHVINMAGFTWARLEDLRQFWHRIASRGLRSSSIQSLV